MTTTIAPEIAAFAAAVRAELADLPHDELDELTDGLEADFTDRVTDAPDAALPDPAEYAAELRTAAGYPSRTTSGLTLRERMGWLGSDLRTGWSALLGRRPLLAGVVAFLVSLRPVWWVLRGIAVYAMLDALLWFQSLGVLTWIVPAALIVTSVQFGRGRWMPRRWMRGAVVAASVIIAALSLPWMAAWAANQLAPQPSAGSNWTPPSGLSRDGVPVGNIFAYDAEGMPLEQVQLFDQNGEPLNLVDAGSAPFAYVFDSMLIPSDDVAGRAGWNVYPLASGTLDEQGNLEDALSPEFPFPNVRALAGLDDTDASDPGQAGTELPGADPESAFDPEEVAEPNP